MVADEFSHLLSLTPSHERSWNDPEFPKAEEAFIKVNLGRALLNQDAEAAYFLCYARVQFNLGAEHLSWQQVDDIFETFAGSDLAPLHWLAYRFYGFKDETQIKYPNVFTDKAKAWDRLLKAIELGDAYSMYEKSLFLNRVGAPSEEIEQAKNLLDRAIEAGSKTASYLKAVWHLTPGYGLEYNEALGLDLLNQGLAFESDKFKREIIGDENYRLMAQAIQPDKPVKLSKGKKQHMLVKIS